MNIILKLRNFFKSHVIARFIALFVLSVLIMLIVILYIHSIDSDFSFFKEDSVYNNKTNNIEEIFYGSSNLNDLKFNINLATKENFMALNEKITSKIADNIIAYREELGGIFYSIEDLLDVDGIGDVIFNAIKNDITV